MERPICPYCKKQCYASGGTITNNVKEKTFSWTCFDCKYVVEDIYSEEIKPSEINHP